MRRASSISGVVLLAFLLFGGCGDQNTVLSVVAKPVADDAKRVGGATEQQEDRIRRLIDQLVFEVRNTKEQAVGSSEVDSDTAEYRKRFDTCNAAFMDLIELRGLTIPILLEYLDDERQSVNFRNHFVGSTVGNACYWNLYYQLVDQPKDYSEYGYSRKGRDGSDHPKPYWQGEPFDDAGGLKQWIAANEELNYLELQIKCLRWLLEREKEIGAPDAESYFLNILPLEIRILERRVENGEDAERELIRMMRIRDGKLVGEIPADLLPPT